MKLTPVVLLISLAALCACSSSKSSTSSVDQAQFNDYRTQGTTNATADKTQGLGVNAYLWRGTLDTLSFMPLVSADPFGGVIITDWYTPPGVTGERFKATIYILGRELRADGLRVSIFRQTNTGSGWQDSQTAPSTSSEIEDKILARARQLRATANAG